MVASSLDNLAVALASQNKFDPAAANYSKSLAIREGFVVLNVYFLARVLDAKESLARPNLFTPPIRDSSTGCQNRREVLPAVLDHYASVLRKANKPAIAAKIEAQTRLLERKKQTKSPELAISLTP